MQTDAPAVSAGSVPCVLADGSRVYLYKRKIGAYGGTNGASVAGTSGVDGVGSPLLRSSASSVAR